MQLQNSKQESQCYRSSKADYILNRPSRVSSLGLGKQTGSHNDVTKSATCAKTKSMRRSISFEDSVRVRYIPPAQELDSELKSQCWYNDQELKTFKRNAHFVSQTWKSSNIFRSQDEMIIVGLQQGIDNEDISTARGLELRISDHRKEERNQAVRMVLRHYLKNRADENGLCEISQKFSRNAMKIAHELAMQDQSEA